MAIGDPILRGGVVKALIADIDSGEFNVANKLAKLDANVFLSLSQVVGNVPSLDANGKLILTGSSQIGTKTGDLAELWSKTTKIVTADIDSNEFNVASKLVKLDASTLLLLAQIPNLPASRITSGDIASARMQANILAAVNASIEVTKIANAQLVDIAWSKVLKTGSSLADLATRSAAALNSGDLASARMSTNGVVKSLFDAYSLLYADTDNTPAALTIAASRIIGRKATGGIAALTGAECRTILDCPSNAEALSDTLFDANTILAADTDDTPAALTITEQTLLGRITAGNIAALSIAQVKTLLGAAAASGLATLDASSLLVQNLNASKISAGDIASARMSTNGVVKSLFDANTILKADSDNTPAALTVAEQRLVGRITAGSITALTAAQVKTLLAIAIADISNIPGTIASILTDHDKAAHDALGIDAATVDSIEGAEILQRDGSVPLTADWPIGDGKSAVLDPTLGTNSTATGIVIDDQTAGENLVFGDLVYFKSDSKWWKANATSAATTDGMLGLVLETINAQATGKILIKGFVRYDTWNFTVAQWLYVGETDGTITGTAPSDTGDQVRKIGTAYTADIIYFNPDSTIVEI